MSTKNQLLASLLAACTLLGGSSATRRAREYFCAVFALLLSKAGFHHVRNVVDIRMRHVRALLAHIAGKSPRTQCNYLSHLRNVLRVSGNPQVLAILMQGNRALGIPPGSRLGTKCAMQDVELRNLLQSIESPNLRALLKLQRAIGLRALEALRSGPCLGKWLERLEQGENTIEVFLGTKGGRPRLTRLPDPARAIDALREAIAIRDRFDHIVLKPTLKIAVVWYRNSMHHLGVQGHRLRYAFACEAVNAYVASGMTLSEAFARVSMDLGHGDGRGRWVKMVYCREIFASQQQTYTRR